MKRTLHIAWRNLRQYRSRLIALFVVTVLGAAACLISLGVVAQAAAATHHRLTEGAALRTIEVRQLEQREDLQGLTEHNISKLTAISHVQTVEPTLQASFGIKTQDIQGVLLYATITQDSRRPPLLRAARPQVFPLGPGEVVLPGRSQGTSLEPLLDKSVSITATRQVAQGRGEQLTENVRVVGIYDPSFQDDGPSVAYAGQSLTVRLAAAKAGMPATDFLAVIGYSQADVIVDEAANVEPTLAAVRAAGFNAVSLSSRLTELPSSLKLLRGFGYVVLGILLVFCAVTGFMLAGTFVRSRTREIGVIKALGFSPRRVMAIFLTEMGIAGLLSTVLGVVIGNVASGVVLVTLRGKELLGVQLPDDISLPSPLWSAALLVVPVLSLLLGATAPARKAAALPADTALRDW